MLTSAMSSKISAIALGICLPLLAAAAQPRVEVVTTDRADFAAGGLIRGSRIQRRGALTSGEDAQVDF